MLLVAYNGPQLQQIIGQVAMTVVNVNTITVTNLKDTGEGSLRDAIQEINKSIARTNVIDFDVKGTITLASALDWIAVKNVKIEGPGMNDLTIQRDPNAAHFQIFHFSRNSSAEVDEVTIANGWASGNQEAGGGIFATGSLTLKDVDITNNKADGFGGGIYMASESGLTLSHSFIDQNESRSSGGGIFIVGQALITSSHVFSNHAGHEGGAIDIFGFASVTVTGGSQIYGNDADSNGGGIANSGNLTMLGGLLQKNETKRDGYSRGGGLYNLTSTGSASLNSVDIERNQADKGGGVYAELGKLVLNNCVLSNNIAKLGAGGAFWQKEGKGTIIRSGGTITDPIAPDKDPPKKA